MRNQYKDNYLRSRMDEEQEPEWVRQRLSIVIDGNTFTHDEMVPTITFKVISNNEWDWMRRIISRAIEQSNPATRIEVRIG